MTEARTATLERLTDRQREVLAGWLPDVQVVADHSWGLTDAIVLEVLAGGRRLIVKTGDADGKHLGRELRAHREWLGPWRAIGVAATLVHADEDAGLLVTEHLPGRLVLGHSAQDDTATFRRAGEILALLHGQHAETDEGYEAAERDKTLMLLERTHRIAADVVDALRADIARWDTPPVTIVPTHGDWQPRNWLVDDEGVVRVIDMGRAALRPAMTDLARLAAQDFRARPDLEAAFLAGYGPDPRTATTESPIMQGQEPDPPPTGAWRASGLLPRTGRRRPPSEPDQACNTPAPEPQNMQGQEPDPPPTGAWHRLLVREAVGTVVWAHEVGHEAFEAQGHRMIAEALADDAR